MSRLVCLCAYVDKKEILAALKKGAVTTKDIQKITGAGQSCGRCLPEIDSLVEEFLQNKPAELQQKLF